MCYQPFDIDLCFVIFRERPDVLTPGFKECSLRVEDVEVVEFPGFVPEGRRVERALGAGYDIAGEDGRFGERGGETLSGLG